MKESEGDGKGYEKLPASNVNDVVISDRNVQFASPDTALFQAPAQFTRHASMDQLMQAAMAKMLGGGK